MKDRLSLELHLIAEEMTNPDVRWGQNLRSDFSMGFLGTIYTAYQILFSDADHRITDWMKRLEHISTEAFHQKDGNPLGNEVILRLSKVLSMLRAKAGIAAYYSHLAREASSSHDVSGPELEKQFQEHFSQAQINMIVEELKALEKLCAQT